MSLMHKLFNDFSACEALIKIKKHKYLIGAMCLCMVICRALNTIGFGAVIKSFAWLSDTRRYYKLI